VTGRVPSTISRQAALCAAAAVRPIRIRNTLVAARVSYADKSLAWGHGFQAHVGPMRSYSRGWVRLASADLAEAPHIRFKDRTGPESTGSPTSGCQSHTSFTRGPTTVAVKPPRWEPDAGMPHVRFVRKVPRNGHPYLSR
jgi:choline dehydrogenase-like flavoprotein